jgi:hypothetical protein
MLITVSSVNYVPKKKMVLAVIVYALERRYWQRYIMAYTPCFRPRLMGGSSTLLHLLIMRINKAISACARYLFLQGMV